MFYDWRNSFFEISVYSITYFYALQQKFANGGQRRAQDVREANFQQFINIFTFYKRADNKPNQTTVRQILFQISKLLLLDRCDTLRHTSLILVVF